MSYQSQLDRRRDILDSTEMKLRAQITELEGQLARTRDSYSSQVNELISDILAQLIYLEDLVH